MRKLILSISVLCFLGIIYAGCKHEIMYPVDSGNPGGGGNAKPPEPAATCSPDSVYFVNTVLPILTSNCAMSGCHDAGSHVEGLVLNNYAGIMRIVRAGNAGSSKLVSVITTSSSGDVMPPPPAARLTTAQINAIKTWINQGAKNNNCASCDSALFTFSGAIKSIMDTKCVGCHNAALSSGGYDLSTYNGVKSAAAGGRLMGSINQSAGFVAMPQGGYKLPDCEIAQVRQWVEAGMPNN